MVTRANANHLFGGELYYKHVSGNTYTITLVMYGDCGTNNPSVFNSLYTATPQILIQNGNQNATTIYLGISGTGVEVTPVCPAEANNTVCKGGSIPGVTRFEYQASYTFPATSSNWRVIFNGQLGNSSAGRSSNMTNIISGASVMRLECVLNNTLAPNNTATLTTIPTPFYCINKNQQYNPGATDIDGDSLTFELIPGYEATTGPGGTPIPATYLAGYTYSNPVHTSTGNFSFSTTTGQFNFTPDLAQNSLVVIRTNEYRNGVLVGSMMREMTFVVLPTCNNTPTTGAIDSLIDAAVSPDGSQVRICSGQQQLQFSIKATDADGDKINITYSGLPAGSTLAINNNNTTTASGLFTWNTANINPGTYTFYVTYTDDGCPLSSKQTVAYSVTIVPPPTLDADILSETQCLYKAKVLLKPNGQDAPWTMQVSDAHPLHTFTGVTGSQLDSLNPGTYYVNIKSKGQTCVAFDTIVISDSGPFPFAPEFDSVMRYCVGDTPDTLTQLNGPYPGAILHWYDAQGNLLGTKPTPNTSTQQTYFWTVEQQFKTCISARDTIQMYVTNVPNPFFELPASICDGDTLPVTFTGTASPEAIYHWNWDDGHVITGTGAGPYTIGFDQPGFKPISLLIDDRGCKSVVNIRPITVKNRPGVLVGASDICIYDTATITYLSQQLQGTQYTWNFGGGAVKNGNGAGPYVLNYTTPGTKTITLNVTTNGCSNDTTLQFQVRPRPTLVLRSNRPDYCMGDSVILTLAGAQTAEWIEPEGVASLSETTGTYWNRIFAPARYRVIGTDTYGCYDTAVAQVNDVAPCCEFGYPNAFTPNGDGANDRFNVKTRGNYEQYFLVVYNRWGQEVYRTVDANRGWDGTIAQQPAPSNTYFYYFRAKCYNGKTEEHKGDVILLR
jgi:gliding motility-associated-like protein